MNCYFVFGPESSGNRLMARFLIQAGCEGDPDVIQRDFSELLLSGKENIVLHRSFPYGAIVDNRHWPNIPQLVAQAKEYGYEPLAIVMTRDMMCATKSAAKAHLQGNTQKATENYLHAMLAIFDGISHAKLNFCVVSYESLVKRRDKLIEWLFPMLGLEPVTPEEEIVDANNKWYE